MQTPIPLVMQGRPKGAMGKKAGPEGPVVIDF